MSDFDTFMVFAPVSGIFSWSETRAPPQVLKGCEISRRGISALAERIPTGLTHLSLELENVAVLPAGPWAHRCRKQRSTAFETAFRSLKSRLNFQTPNRLALGF